MHTNIQIVMSDEKQRFDEEQAVQTIQRVWWIHIRKRLFKLLKHTICAAEHCVSYDIMKRVCPLEAELLKDPTIRCKVRFRFAGSYFPPFIVFKIFCKSGGQSSHYISGKRLITSRSEAAVDACKLMGYRKYYNQILRDELQHKKYGITDEMDVATIRDYVQYLSHMDEMPAYFGGRHNYWRKLTLEDFPRAMIMYDIIDYAQSWKLSPRLRKALPFLLLKPPNEETSRAQVLVVCHIRSPVPCITIGSLSRLQQMMSHRISGRRSYRARKKIAKMKKVYRTKDEGEEHLSDTPSSSDHSGSTHSLADKESLFSDEDWEQEAIRLYDWSKSLQAEELGVD